MITFFTVIMVEVMKYRDNNEMKVAQGRVFNLGERTELMNSDCCYEDQQRRILE